MTCVVVLLECCGATIVIVLDLGVRVQNMRIQNTRCDTTIQQRECTLTATDMLWRHRLKIHLP